MCPAVGCQAQPAHTAAALCSGCLCRSHAAVRGRAATMPECLASHHPCTTRLSDCRSMSDRALQTRIWKIRRADKLHSFIKVWRGGCRSCCLVRAWGAPYALRHAHNVPCVGLSMPRDAWAGHFPGSSGARTCRLPLRCWRRAGRKSLRRRRSRRWRPWWAVAAAAGRRRHNGSNGSASLHLFWIKSSILVCLNSETD